MDSQVFADPDRAASEAARRLQAGHPGLDRTAAARVIERLGVIQRREAEPGSDGPRPDGLHPALVAGYAIRDDLLWSLANLLDLVKSAGGLLCGVLSLPTPAGLKDTAAGLHALYESGSRIVAQGWRLTDEELVVVLALRRGPPARAAELAGRLAGVGPERVEAVLHRLERRPDNPNGIACRGEDGVWRLEGV